MALCSRLAVVALLVASQLAAQEQRYDLIIRNGRIVDGSGNPWYRADVAIRGGRIVRIAGNLTGMADREIDAAGQVVAPGFIDIHTHAAGNIFEVPSADNYIRQGVTTVMVGQDGSSPVPLGPFLSRLDSLGKSVNVGAFIGHGSIRAAVMGEVDRDPADQEAQQMQQLVEEGMLDGAFGLSTGLFYVPGTFSSAEEVIALAKVVGSMGGIHISHLRDETSGVVESVRETIAIGERGGLPTQVTHHKVIGVANSGKSKETLRLIDEARARGVDATIDLYPYTASSTGIQAALFPAWAEEGGSDRVLERLGDEDTRARVKRDVMRIIREERGGGDLSKVVIAQCDWNPDLAGKNLADVAELRGMDRSIGSGAEAAMWLVEQGGCQGVFHAINEQDLEQIIRHPAAMIASDGGIPLYAEGSPHPRSYGAFARVLATYVRDLGTLTLEDAIRKMTSLPAQRLGLVDRGVLRPGMKADIAVFDPATVRDRATFEDPHQYAEGFSLVVVNGEVVWDGKRVTPARPGVLLFGPAHSGAHETDSSGFNR